jgi:hypothetical protein
MLYRGMDRAQLDAAYNNRAAVANAADILADWAARSDRVRQAHPLHLNEKGSGTAYLSRPREAGERLWPWR